MAHRPKIAMGKRLAVYVRDNWTCQYCGLVFTPADDEKTGRYAPWMEGPKKFFDGMWLELDHIVPRSLGGDDSIENLRAAWSPCNKRKLATTLRVDWDARIAMAQAVLTAGPANEDTVRKAAAVLIGCLQGDVPAIRGRNAEVDING